MLHSDADGPCRIVIADGDAEVCQLLARTLHCPSLELTVLSGPGQLIARLQARGADVLLFEPLLLGWRAGLEFCTTLTNTSIIVVTTRTGREDIRAARLAGAVDVITKPFSPRDVRRRVVASCPRHLLSG